MAVHCRFSISCGTEIETLIYLLYSARIQHATGKSYAYKKKGVGFLFLVKYLCLGDFSVCLAVSLCCV